MNLRSRLDMLERGREQAALAQKASRTPLEAIIGGTILTRTEGNFHCRSQRLGGHLTHGPGTLCGARDFPIQHLRDWERNLGELDPARVVFLDTETTGLSGGSGTYAFMVGLAFFEDDQLVVEQLIMREHCEEKAMLAYLWERLRNCGGLVTFNGKSFDVPLLQTRFMMNRQRVLLEDFPHLDLLHLSRRLWSSALADCKLETLERELLGLPRHDDVPGWLVPQLYFRYLQKGDARGLAQVAEHNRRDLLAMVGLLSGLRGYAETPLDHTRRFLANPAFLASEDLNLARWFFRLRQRELSADLCERALEQLGENKLRRQACLLLARCGRVADNSVLWLRMLGWDPEDLTALEELAKHHEHRLGQPHVALGYVEKALTSTLLTPAKRKRLCWRKDRLIRRSSSANG